MSWLKYFVVACALASSVAAAPAVPILSGSVSFDNGTGLYTYSYVIDNTSGPIAIQELSIIIDSSQNFGAPLSFPPTNTTPAGWFFLNSTSGTIAEPPLNEFGSLFQWRRFEGVAVGSVLSGFSFTLDVAPTSSLQNNYFLYNSSYSGGPPNIGGGGVIEFGHIVAPDYGASVVPLPAALPLFAAGLGVLGLLGWRRKRKAQVAA